MKRVREREAQKKAEEGENHIQMDRRVCFTDDEDDDEAFAFNQIEVEKGEIGQNAQAFCEKHKEKNLAKVLLIDSGSTVDLIQDKKCSKISRFMIMGAT